jgi:hypothetical protein
VIYSNAVTTVSPTYANEVLNGGQAGWLRSTLLRPEVKSKVRVFFWGGEGGCGAWCQCGEGRGGRPGWLAAQHTVAARGQEQGEGGWRAIAT